jgi:hypothetical protein
MRTRPTVMHARRPRRRRTRWRGTHVCSLLLTSSFTPGGTTTRRGGTVPSTGSAARAVPHQAAGLFTFQNQRPFSSHPASSLFPRPETPRRPLPAGARETPTSRARQTIRETPTSRARQITVKPRQAGRDSTSLPRPLKGPNKPVLDSAGPEVTVRTGPVCYWWPAACCRAETSREAKSHSPNRSGTQNPSTSSRRHKGVIDRNVPSEFLIPELSRPASPQARFADWLRPASFRGCFPSGVANTAPGFPTQIPFLGCGSTFRDNQSRFQS